MLETKTDCRLRERLIAYGIMRVGGEKRRLQHWPNAKKTPNARFFKLTQMRRVFVGAGGGVGIGE